MPKVGKKEFDYTEKGKAEAKAYAKETGQNIEKGSGSMAYESSDARNRSETYKAGGKVKPRIHDASEEDKPVTKRDWGHDIDYTLKQDGKKVTSQELFDKTHLKQVGSKKQARIAKEIKESLKKKK